MSKITNYVLGIYEEIFTLEPEKRLCALRSWYEYLRSTCTPENQCVECLMEMEAQEQAESVLCLCRDLDRCDECLDRAEREYRRAGGDIWHWWGKGR